MALLEIEGLRVARWGRPALDGLDLSVEAGEVRAILGERRAGKSSLALTLAGGIPRDGGRIAIAGREFAKASPKTALALGVGVFFQESTLVPSLTAGENVVAGRKGIGFRGSSERGRAELFIRALAERWGQKPELRVPARRLSGIESAIVELARALAHEPRLIVLDEPAGRFTADELQVLYGLVAEESGKGKAILYLASTVDEVFAVADIVSILKGGRMHDTRKVVALDRDRLIDLAYSFTESREELLRKNIELQKYRRYNEEIISNLPIGTVILDASGLVYLANDAAIAFLGTRGGTGLEGLIAQLDASTREELSQAVREGRRGEWKAARLKAVNERDRGRILSIVAFPFHDAEGRSLGTILALDDVSEELEAREYLVRAERSSSIAELAAGVAHEVNNPLAIISNYVELLIMRPQERYTSERLGIVQDEIRRIQGIVASLLSFARIGPAVEGDADLAEVVADCALLLSHEAERRGIALVAETGTGPLLARADPSRVKQVLINLVVNALEALGNGGTVRMSIAVEEGSGRLSLAVEDDGPGIPEVMLEELFRPFSPTAKGKAHAGLGLSVCKHIVEAHGGSITCESRPGRTLFRVLLPVMGLGS
jgi:two-component system sensor histidine kinase AtoS